MTKEPRVIMFVDMIGSTELKYREESSVTILIQKLYQMVHRVARNPLLVKFTGDGAMIVFSGGREGSLDAIESARAIIIAVDDYNLSFKNPSRDVRGAFIRLQVRLGIAAGECVEIEMGSADVVGRPADLASRLSQAAEVDQILITREAVKLSGMPRHQFEPVKRRLVLKGIPLPEHGVAESFYSLKVSRLVHHLLPKTFPSGMLRVYTSRAELDQEFGVANLLERAEPDSEVLVVGRTLVTWANMPVSTLKVIQRKRLHLKFVVSSEAACRSMEDESVAIISRHKIAALPFFKKLVKSPHIKARFRETEFLMPDGFTCARVVVGETVKDIVLRDINSGPKTSKVTILFACTCDNDVSRRSQCITCGMKERGTKLFEKFSHEVF
ncbi:MAG: adenylate/guanylate cyclase domain-containing protein [Verrucomicrobiaceae bacterium]